VQIFAQQVPILEVKIRIGQVAGQCGGDVMNSRTEEERMLPLDQQLEMRQISGIPVKQPVRSIASG
jgi:hypothetical protein